MSDDEQARANAAWSAALVASLAAGGRQAVVAPGSRSAPVALALAEHPAVRTHVVVDERSAGFVALGIGRASGRAAVVLCTSGSAGHHLGPAVAEAALGGVPMVVLTADRPPEDVGAGAPQTGDQLRLFGALPRWFGQLAPPRPGAPGGSWASAGARAVFAAEAPPMGPVHLNVPLRPPLWRAQPPPPAPLPPPLVRRAAAAGLEAAEVAEAAAPFAAAAGAGLVYCGPQPPGAESAALAAPVAALAQRLGWPVLAEAASQWRFGAAAPLLRPITCYEALLGGDGPRPAPRLILHLGGVATATVVQRALAQMGRGRTIQIDRAGRWRDPAHGLAELWGVDPASALAQLLEVLPVSPAPGWAAAWQAAQAEAGDRLAAAAAVAFWEGGIAARLAQRLPPGAVWHLGNSLAVREADALAPGGPAAVAVSASRGLNGIDGAVATALGLAAAGPGGPVVALIGDLALLHDLGSLQLAALAGGRPVVVVVVNNDGGGIFDRLPIAAHPRLYQPLFRTPHGRQLTPICRALGVDARAVAGYEALEEALGELLGRPGLSVIEAVVAAPATAAGRQAVAAAAACLRDNHLHRLRPADPGATVGPL